MGLVLFGEVTLTLISSVLAMKSILIKSPSLIFFNASTNVLVAELAESSNGHMDFKDFGGIPNNAGSGKNGDVLFTTKGASNGDTYSITLEMTKIYS